MSVKPFNRSTVKPERRPPVWRGGRKTSAQQNDNDSTITITNRQRTKEVDKRLLKEIVSTLLVELKISKAELGINLVGAKEMTRVNWQYLQHEGSTDVITFDHSDTPFVIRHSSFQLHGELYISTDDALTQSKEFRTTWQSELVRYIVHGVLHLLGHDDLKPALRRKMKREENRLVRLLEKQFSFARL